MYMSKFFSQDISCFLMLGIYLIPLLKGSYFQMHYVNEEKKHSIIPTPVLGSIFWSDFSFTVYILELKLRVKF